jgi:transposase
VKLCSSTSFPLLLNLNTVPWLDFRRLAAIRGSKRAIIAVASTILTIGYHMLKEGTTYRELGGNYFDKRNLLRTTRRLVKRLEALGHRVILAPTPSPLQSSD